MVHDWPNLVTMLDYPQYNELGFQKCAFPCYCFYALFDLYNDWNELRSVIMDHLLYT